MTQIVKIENSSVSKTQQRLLQAAAAQIKAAVTDSEDEVESLAKRIRDIADGITEVKPSIEGENKDARDNDTVLSAARECMVLLQFHDRMSQRLEHAANMVRLLADRFETKQNTKDDELILLEWMNITSELRTCYTSERERRLFDAILESGPGSSAVGEAENYSQQVSKEDRIELF